MKTNRIIVAVALSLSLSSGAAHAADEPDAFDLVKGCEKVLGVSPGTCHAYSSIYLSQPGRAHVAEQFVAICSTSNLASVEQCREAERAHEINKTRKRK